NRRELKIALSRISFNDSKVIESKNATISASSNTGVWGGFSNQPRWRGPGRWIILNNPSHHQRIKEQPDGRQVLPLRRPASRMLIQPGPHVIGFYVFELKLTCRTKSQK